MTIGAFRLNELASALVASGTITATGGTVSYFSSGSTTYKLHSFTTTGADSFIVSAVTGTPTIDYLLVGGGRNGSAGGTSNYGGGGGGAGGLVISQTSVSVTAQTYSLNIGSGATATTGFGNTLGVGNTGTLTAAATNGGGSGANGSPGTSFTSTAGTYPYKGGNSFGSTNQQSNAGGGGAGAGGAGSNAASNVGGAGGIGIANDITGSTVYYGSGGGGGGVTGGQAYDSSGTLASSGGKGGSSGAGGPGGNATVYGNGGGGGYGTSGTGPAGSGQQGVIYVRYQVPYVASVAYVTNASSTTTSLTFPTIQTGDIAVYGCTAANTTTTIPTSVTPTGFTLLTSATVGTTLGTRTEIFYKICTGSESATTLTNMSGTGSTLSNIVIYRPSSTVNGLVFSTPSIQVTDAVPTNQTLTMTGLTGPYIGFAWGRQSGGFGTVTSTGATKTRSGLVGSSGGWNTYEATSSAVSFSTATLSMNDGGTNSLASFTMRIY
jgi:hypothetical protein